MRDDQLLEEDTYLAIREEQLVRRLERSGHTRREILKRGAAGALLLAGHTQPATVPLNTLGYLFAAVVKHPVTVPDRGQEASPTATLRTWFSSGVALR